MDIETDAASRAELAKTREALARQEAKFRAIAEASPVGIFFYDAAARVDFVNQAGIELCDLPEDEIMERGWEGAVHPDDLQRVRVEVMDAILRGKGYAGSGRGLRRDGRVIWWDASAAPVVVDGELQGFVSVMQDVTERHSIESALRDSQALLRSIMDNSPALITVRSVLGETLFVNKKAAELFGSNAGDGAGTDPASLISADAASAQRQMELQVMRTGKPDRSDEVYVLDGVRTVYSVLRFPIHSAAGPVTAVCTVATDITDRLATEEAIRKERQDLAADIHDDSVQVMAATALRLEAMEQGLEPGPEKEKLRSMADAVREAVGRLRSRMHSLTEPVPVDGGLRAALLEDLRKVSDEQGIVYDLAMAEDLDLAPSIESVLYRIAREAVSNSVKHATASRIIVSVARTASAAEMSIVDDGRGFTVNSIPTRGHIGLATMRERARSAGGACAVSSEPGRGTTVSVRIPLGLTVDIGKVH